MSIDRGLRIGDDERTLAADRLTAHAAAGRLRLDELEDRLDRVNRAVFAGDLLAVEADLPTSRPVDHAGFAQTAGHPRRRRVGRRPPPAAIALLFAAVLGSLLVGHPIAPAFILVAVLWRAGGRRLRPRLSVGRALP